MPRKNKPTDVFKSIDMKDGDKEQCWPWTGKVNKKDGRPYITIGGSRRPVSNVVLELYSSELQQGRIVRHSCDDRICCNPYHLSYGTHQDNMNDMKDRERHGFPKTVIRNIQKLLVEGVTHQEIANRYGCTREAITAINRRLP